MKGFAMDPMALLMFARDNKFEELGAAVALGLPPDYANKVALDLIRGSERSSHHASTQIGS